MTDPNAEILACCQAIITTYDGRVPTGAAMIDGLPSPTGAHAVLYGGSQSPTGSRLAGPARARRATWHVVAVSNNPAGCRTVAGIIVDQLHGHRFDGVQVRVDLVSDPIEDRDDPSEWRWSSTVEASLTSSPRKA